MGQIRETDSRLPTFIFIDLKINTTNKFSYRILNHFQYAEISCLSLVLSFFPAASFSLPDRISGLSDLNCNNPTTEKRYVCDW